MVDCLEEAKKIWGNPEEMIQDWKESKDKKRQEMIILNIAGKVEFLADLGCGSGRFVDVMDFDLYHGYDQSSQMIGIAKETFADRSDVVFHCVDILKFQSDNKYDLAISVDVAIHQDDPIEFIKRLLKIWKAKRFLFTLLCGEEAENLFNSNVCAYEDIPEEWKIVYSERIKDVKFDWVVFEVNE